MENVLEGNKIIAEFMGYEIQVRSDKRIVAIKDDYQYLLSECTMRDIGFGWHPVKFHTSFDWLMPVVEKIEGLGHVVIIQAFNCIIMNVEGAEIHRRADYDRGGKGMNESASSKIVDKARNVLFVAENIHGDKIEFIEGVCPIFQAGKKSTIVISATSPEVSASIS